MCLMLLNPNCLYSFRTVPFTSLLQGGVYPLSHQLIEESCFLPSPKPKIQPMACAMQKARLCLNPDDCEETQRNGRNFTLVQQQQDFHALQ